MRELEVILGFTIYGHNYNKVKYADDSVDYKHRMEVTRTLTDDNKGNREETTKYQL